MRLLPVLVILLLAGLIGCRDNTRREGLTDHIPLDKVPPTVLKVAREKLPDVDFNTAWKTPGGNYEVRGTQKNGKVRDIQVTPKGDVVEID
jgi:hypothetical protein